MTNIKKKFYAHPHKVKTYIGIDRKHLIYTKANIIYSQESYIVYERIILHSYL
jgi:hypothetical protein